MARITHCIKKTSILLRTEHVFGRQPNQSHTTLTDIVASRIHAAIVWCSNHWQLRDVSSNGTYVNGKRLLKYNTVVLAIGDKINFGGSSIEPHVVLDLSPPTAMLEPTPPNAEWIALEDTTSLPISREQTITVYLDHDRWYCKTSTHTSLLQTGDTLGTKERQWTFIGLPLSSHTIALEQHHTNQTYSALTFSVSQNEEHVNVALAWNERNFDLGERTHHYLILLLARKKLEDKKKGVNKIEQGWYNKDQLAKDLGLPERHINIQVFRFRKQLAECIMSNIEAPTIIERRKGEIRLAGIEIIIEGGTGICSLKQTALTNTKNTTQNTQNTNSDTEKTIMPNATRRELKKATSALDTCTT